MGSLREGNRSRKALKNFPKRGRNLRLRDKKQKAKKRRGGGPTEGSGIAMGVSGDSSAGQGVRTESRDVELCR